jgi:16S rRNA pseudouridine516 synthase
VVELAGETVTDPARLLEPAGLAFAVEGTPWRYREHCYLALHKPPGYECSRRPSHHPPVLGLLPVPLARRGVQPVGRLDHDTTGLLLLSDDGAFIHAQSHPRRQVAKTYVATTADPVTEALVAHLNAGVKLHDEPRPLVALARRLGERQVEVILGQGKYHQVKRMLAAAGNHCTALVRTAIGGLALADLGLAPGEWRDLDAGQLGALGAPVHNRLPESAR